MTETPAGPGGRSPHVDTETGRNRAPARSGGYAATDEANTTREMTDMATATKVGDCPKCDRRNVTLYDDRRGSWYCGKCLQKAQAKDRGRR